MKQVNIFVSYAHEDQAWVEEGTVQGLMPWLRNQLKDDSVNFWWDHGIRAGDSWEQMIFEKIDEAQIVVLLLSDDFAGSEYIMKQELPRIRERYLLQQTTVLPILLSTISRRTRDRLNWVVGIQMLPNDKKGLNMLLGGHDWTAIRAEILDEIYHRACLLRTEDGPSTKNSDPSTHPEKESPHLPPVESVEPVAEAEACCTEETPNAEVVPESETLRAAPFQEAPFERVEEKSEPEAPSAGLPGLTDLPTGSAGIENRMATAPSSHVNEPKVQDRRAQPVSVQAETGRTIKENVTATRRRTIIVGILAVLLVILTIVSSEFETGDVVRIAEDDRKAAYQGDASAQFLLARRYQRGDRLHQDHAEAVRWFRKAAEQGLSVAQFQLGTAYSEGVGVEKDQAEALRWFRLAAEQGDILAEEAIADLNAAKLKVADDKVKTVAEAERGGIPYATLVAGREGFVLSPYTQRIIDVRDLPRGALAQEPGTSLSEKKFFRIPASQ